MLTIIFYTVADDLLVGLTCFYDFFWKHLFSEQISRR